MLSNYGIGGNEVKLDAKEGIIEIPQNRTLIAQKLSSEAPVRPELVEGLHSVEQVFEHFKPEIKIGFENAEGATKNETLKFKNIGDFGIEGITAQSTFLTDLETEKDQYSKIIKQLKSNKILKAALEDADAKKALIDSIESLISELDKNELV
ncbi:hypothetical protein [uncultured Flavobacterium sp.]|uniref:hypothetical protein n=1 Tax=uncultured Flavobacterium sp. TaxID=165435 RepID=UPI0025F26EFE|nr:hypothetical protein [uncultured Flavobacterium sp.]